MNTKTLFRWPLAWRSTVTNLQERLTIQKQMTHSAREALLEADERHTRDTKSLLQLHRDQMNKTAAAAGEIVAQHVQGVTASTDGQTFLLQARVDQILFVLAAMPGGGGPDQVSWLIAREVARVMEAELTKRRNAVQIFLKPPAPLPAGSVQPLSERP